MKSQIMRFWDPDNAARPTLCEQDKSVVRDNLLEAIIFALPVVRTQLALCLRIIAHTDYPAKLPALLPAICTNLRQACTPPWPHLFIF